MKSKEKVKRLFCDKQNIEERESLKAIFVDMDKEQEDLSNKLRDSGQTQCPIITLSELTQCTELKQIVGRKLQMNPYSQNIIQL